MITGDLNRQIMLASLALPTFGGHQPRKGRADLVDAPARALCSSHSGHSWLHPMARIGEHLRVDPASPSIIGHPELSTSPAAGAASTRLRAVGSTPRAQIAQVEQARGVGVGPAGLVLAPVCRSFC
jgi:hypothetical protein